MHTNPKLYFYLQIMYSKYFFSGPQINCFYDRRFSPRIFSHSTSKYQPCDNNDFDLCNDVTRWNKIMDISWKAFAFFKIFGAVCFVFVFVWLARTWESYIDGYNTFKVFKFIVFNLAGELIFSSFPVYFQCWRLGTPKYLYF